MGSQPRTTDRRTDSAGSAEWLSRLVLDDRPESQGLVDKIYFTLRSAIVSGQLQPGLRLREIQLSKHFLVSTTPLREALRRLEFDGLVVVLPRRGAVVALHDPRRVRDLYEMRELIEGEAAARAAEAVARGAEMSSVRDVVAQIADALQEPDQLSFNLLDITFHRVLNDLGDNELLAAEAERLHRQIQTVRLRCAVQLPNQPAKSHSQHLDIVSAVEGGDAELARALARAHVRSVRDSVINVLLEASP